MNDQQQSRADELTDEHIATLKLAARAVTPQDIDGAERIESRPDGSYITCPACEGEGCIPFESDYCNYDHVAIGVQFYGVGTEPGAAEAYFRAAKPATILALLDRLERAESALAAPPVEQPAAPPIVSAPASDARECLMDVVSHYDNIVAGFAAQRLAAEEAQDSDTAGYWKREIDVAHRMKAQAERALAAAAPADERAALPQIPDLVKATAWLTMCLRTELSRLDDTTHKALDEVEAQLSCVRAITNGAIDYEAMVPARAAASPAAEAVAFEVTEEIAADWAKRHDIEHVLKHHSTQRNAIEDARTLHLLDAPQPAQAASPAAERVTDALQALSADVHTLGDGWANDEAMIGLAKKYLRVEPKPASPELSLWRDFVLLAVTDTAPQPAQADAPRTIPDECAASGASCSYAPEGRHGEMQCRYCGKAQADAQAEAREPIAWITDDDRAITAAQKQRALADGGATASSVRPYSVPCYAVSAPADAGEARLTDAARDMLAERRRQVEAEGWTPKHDDEHDKGEMARAAACYALHAGSCFAWRADAYQSAKPHEGNPAAQDSLWPWDMQWWKPKDPRRDLVRAGALILAELERLDRAALLNGADR